MEENEYKELIGKIKMLLEDAAKQGKIFSYKELGDRLGISAERAREAVGIRFTELTRKAYNPFVDADPDFFLLGDTIKEISGNKMYISFKKAKLKQLDRTAKFMSTTDKINRI